MESAEELGETNSGPTGMIEGRPSSSEFNSSTRLRQFEIELVGGSLFVNAHWLAELSPYFSQICFGESFIESRNGRVSISDVARDDVIRMLEYLLPDSNYLPRKLIGEFNLASLILCSHRFQVPSLQHDVETYIECQIPKSDCHWNEEFLIEVIIESQAALFRSSLLRVLYKKLAELGQECVTAALKDFPDSVSKQISDETSKYIVFIPQPTHQSSYDWNYYDRRLFF